jgi:arylsulfotransferase ASST
VPKDASAPYDYFHVNSVEPGPNDTLIVSARHTHAVYEISKRTGRIVWRLGGKRSDFEMGPGTRVAWQHDARLHPDGTLTIFDDGAAPAVEKRSRAIVLRLDTHRMTARLVRAYVHPDGLLASSQGNMQVLPDGHVLVGWGSEPYVTEFSNAGEVVFDMRFNKGADSYRAYRFPWVGHPTGRPSLAAKRKKDDVQAWASWNGATQVRSWALLAGPDAAHLSRIAVVSRNGFETPIDVHTKARRLAVEALDAAGRVLGTSLPR